jgi:hypothetical protein
VVKTGHSACRKPAHFELGTWFVTENLKWLVTTGPDRAVLVQPSGFFGTRFEPSIWLGILVGYCTDAPTAPPEAPPPANATDRRRSAHVGCANVTSGKGIGAKFDRVVRDLRLAKLFAQCILDPLTNCVFS